MHNGRKHPFEDFSTGGKRDNFRVGESFHFGVPLSKEQDWEFTSCWPSFHAEKSTCRRYATQLNKTRSI